MKNVNVHELIDTYGLPLSINLRLPHGPVHHWLLVEKCPASYGGNMAKAHYLGYGGRKMKANLSDSPVEANWITSWDITVDLE